MTVGVRELRSRRGVSVADTHARASGGALGGDGKVTGGRDVTIRYRLAM